MARLPEVYVEARNALSKCARIDECKNWEAKAEALRSYAVQMKDDKMVDYAKRIKARAVRRGGELLLAMKVVRGRAKGIRGTGSPNSRKAAATKAGLSPDQAKTMIRVASVPTDRAEAMIEGSPPATISALADAGTRKSEAVKPRPYRAEWSDWTIAVRRLSTLPGCGLDVLAKRMPEMTNDLLTECQQAKTNLESWLATLEAARCPNARRVAS